MAISMALDGDGKHPTTGVDGRKVSLVGDSIVGKNENGETVSVSSSLLKDRWGDFRAYLEAFQQFQFDCKDTFGWTDADFHPIPDWVRMAFAWQEEQQKK